LWQRRSTRRKRMKRRKKFDLFHSEYTQRQDRQLVISYLLPI
jgi:hypothetical protein